MALWQGTLKTRLEAIPEFGEYQFTSPSGCDLLPSTFHRRDFSVAEGLDTLLLRLGVVFVRTGKTYTIDWISRYQNMVSWKTPILQCSVLAKTYLVPLSTQEGRVNTGGWAVLKSQHVSLLLIGMRIPYWGSMISSRSPTQILWPHISIV